MVTALRFTGPAAAAVDDACRPQGPLQSASLARVVDGDSITIRKGEPLRLIGINTPELGRDGMPDEPGAVAAKRALEQLLAGRKRIWLAADREAHDRYGRRLAHVYTDPAAEPVAADLLRQGLGWRVAVPPNLALQNCLSTAERQARRERRGVWAAASAPTAAAEVRFAAAPPVPHATSVRPGFARVGVTIVDVIEDSTGWWLETGDRLVLRIDRADLHHFELAAETEAVGDDGGAGAAVGADPLAWIGQRWYVRGWIVDRSGSAAARSGHAPLLLQLRHPSMLEQTVGRVR